MAVEACSVSGCEKESLTRGMCSAHYQADRLKNPAWRNSRDGRRTHPLYSIWRERRVRGSLCAAWGADFWAFANVVTARPTPSHLLRRPDPKQKYGPGNWVWMDALRREPGETRKAFNARKWASRREREPEYERRRWLKRKYGITAEDYDRMLAAQGGVCAICKEPETQVHAKTGMVNSLAVDHCHDTMRVRGLLCWRCNIVIGKVGDCPDMLRSMISYLAEPA